MWKDNLKVIGAWICIAMSVISFIQYIIEEDVLKAVGLCFFWCIIGMICLSSTSKEFQKAYNEYERQERHKKLTSGYKCPNCGWSAGHEISVSSKRVSVRKHGLASNQIGKTYQCASCGYKW